MEYRFGDPILDCLLKTILELGRSTEQHSSDEMKWTNADLLVKSSDDIIVKFKIIYGEEGKVEGRIQTFKINEDGEPEPFDLREILGNEINRSELSDELSNIEINWHDKKSVSIVVCSKGYPDKYKNNILIKNINKIELKSNQYLYHAGTKKNENNIYSNGGRVLNFISLSDNFKQAQNDTINLIKKLDWKDGFFRKDIGHKVISE